MQVKNLHTYVFFALILLALWLFGLVMLPYISMIAISIVLAVLVYPWYTWIVKKIKREGIASTFTLILLILIIFVPLSIFIGLIVREAGDFVVALQGDGLVQLSGQIASFEVYIQRLVPQFSIDIESLSNQGVSLLANNLSGIFSSTLHTVTSILIGLVLIYYLLKDGKRFITHIEEKSPLGQKNTSRILAKFKVVIDSVIRGNLVMALIQGVLVGIGFALFGIPNAALWAGVAVIMALIPAIGTSLVVLGGILYALAYFSPATTLGLVAWSAVIVGLVDDALRPYLIGRGAHIHPMLVLLAVVGGFSAFGPIGFILGPIILSLFIVVFEMYKEVVGE